MRTVILLICLPGLAIAQDPKDKFILPKSQMEAILMKDRDAAVKKLNREAEELERAITEATAPKSRRERAAEVGYSNGEVSGFKVPLTRPDLVKAKAKVKELKTEIAKLKAQKPVIPEVEYWSLPFNDPESKAWQSIGICKLVTVKSNVAGGNEATPLAVEVREQRFNGELLFTKTPDGKQIAIEADAKLYHVGQLIVLDMPVRITSYSKGKSRTTGERQVSSVAIERFEK
jgi:hypothetical protein